MSLDTATVEELRAALLRRIGQPGTCAACGAAFYSAQGRRTCSGRCRVALYYRRLREDAQRGRAIQKAE